MKNNCKSRLIFGSVNLDIESELNFIHASDHKIYERIATTIFGCWGFNGFELSGYQLATIFVSTKIQKGHGDIPHQAGIFRTKWLEYTTLAKPLYYLIKFRL